MVTQLDELHLPVSFFKMSDCYQWIINNSFPSHTHTVPLVFSKEPSLSPFLYLIYVLPLSKVC